MKIGDEDPGLGACDGFLEVLGGPSAAAEPGEGSLHDRSTRQDLEALGLIRTLDDLNRPLADLAQLPLQLLAGISAVGKDMA